MEYIAQLRRDGRRTVITFPDCPGCQTFAERRDEIDSVAREALEGWLETHLVTGDLPPLPSARDARRGKSREERRRVTIDPALALRLTLRWARHARGLSQGELAKLTGVSRQQISLLEAPDTNPTLLTLQKVAEALGMDLQISLIPRSSAA
ncbi:MAG TPA: type II toxin-antitoxin system HicB family antitoxin [Gemmatimonadaceae bacterium]|jgi:DNA-binding XRE family transcriptional regulator